MISHLVVGVLAGTASGSLSLMLGAALWQAGLFYVLGLNLGTAASALLTWLHTGREAPEDRRSGRGHSVPMRVEF
jgi:NhaP-type Na+/H+ or K+/H+ antiporter